MAGTHARPHPERGARHVLEVSGRTLAYEPARRAEVFALLDRVRGYELDPAEFDWWFDGNPVGPRTIALAEEDGSRGRRARREPLPRGRRTAERRSSTLPLWAVTDPEFQGRGIFQRLNGEVERAARETGAALELGFTNKLAGPIYIAKLGWLDVARLRIWARPLAAAAATATTGSGSQRFGPEQEDAYRALRDRLPSHFVRDSAYLNWRYADSPRAYTLLASPSGLRRRRAQAVPRRRHRVRRRPRRPDVPRDAPAAPALRARGARGARVARAASRSARERVRVGRVRADARDDPPDRACARTRRASARAEGVALHARRHGLLLMRKLVFITQQVDPAHHALAATVPMIRALAAQRRRARRARRRRGGRGAPGERARAAVPRPSQGRPRPALRGGARARARPEARRRRRAHVPDLRGARRAARAAARDSARALVHALACEPDAASRRGGLVGGGERRPALLPARLAEGARDRPRDRPRRVPVPRPSVARTSSGCSRSGATRRRRGSTSSCARSAARSTAGSTFA